MVTRSTQGAPSAGPWDMLYQLALSEGAAGHRFYAILARPHAPQRDLCDLVHALCAVHGDHPGLIDAALARSVAIESLPWLMDGAAGFAVERAYLAQLTAAVGPLPSTHGQAETHAVMVAQHHTFGMLGASSRHGCAIGAVAAFLIDWTAMRLLLDATADRCGIDVPSLQLPAHGDTVALVERIGTTTATERAIAFGAQQVFAQHRGLWDLLETRAGARQLD